MTRTTNASPRPRVAIIGAGAAGLACGRRLVEAQSRVTVFDKGRRPGGRIATRRTSGFAFDHGAQYVTTESNAADSVIATAVREGAVVPWDATIVSLRRGHTATVDDGRRRWVGVPGMSALPQHLSAGMDIRNARTIASVRRAGDAWRLAGESGSVEIETDIVVVAVPAPQAAPLLAESSALADRAAAATMAPCWTVLLGFETPLALPFDGAFVDDGALAWISRNGSKPGRTGGDAWVLHASPGWSRDHLEADRPAVLEHLCLAFRETIGTNTPTPTFAAAHRWRYARAERPLSTACLFDPELGIGACGDWCLGGKIEAAMQSGRALAERIIAGSGPAPMREHSYNRR